MSSNVTPEEVQLEREDEGISYNNCDRTRLKYMHMT